MEYDVKTKNIKKNRSYDIDCMKFLLSIFVVMIHSNVNVGFFKPFLRIAVPLFFITSSYFFFKKINNASNQREVLIKFVKRNLILYSFWFIILLPITLFLKNWFSNGFFMGIVSFFQSLFFNSTFRASWYLMALTLGMCICFIISKHLSSKTQLLITLPIYLICCLFTNYYGLAEKSSHLISGYNFYISIFCSLANSFPVSLFWISLGRYFSQNKKESFSKRYPALIVVSSCFLVLEYIIIKNYNLQLSDDCYIMLVPLCYFIFCCVKESSVCEKTFGNKRLLNRFLTRTGNISTIIYVTHASVISVLSYLIFNILSFEFVGINWIIFLLTIVICYIICVVIFYLENIKCFKWIRNAY